MDFRQMQCFIAVAEALSFHRAAQALHMTQPPLSRQIRLLEDELGVQLFVRNSRRVLLTDNGRLLLHKSRTVMAKLDEIRDLFGRASHGETGTVKLGVGVALGKAMSGVICDYTERFPEVDVQCKDVFGTVVVKALSTGEIDIGIARFAINTAQLASEQLFEESFFVVLPKRSPLAKRKKLRVKELADQVLLVPKMSPVNEQVMQMYYDADLAPAVVRTVLLPHETGAALVTSGKGIYIIPGTPANLPSFGAGMAIIPLDEPSRVHVHMAWRRGKVSAPVLNFLDTARKVFNDRSAQLSAAETSTYAGTVAQC